jgi:trans-aconitate methyltransferase
MVREVKKLGLETCVTLGMLDYMRIAPKRILDLGCGTGDDLARRLAECYSDAEQLGVDFAPPMLVRAGQRLGQCPVPICEKCGAKHIVVEFITTLFIVQQHCSFLNSSLTFRRKRTCLSFSRMSG